MRTKYGYAQEVDPELGKTEWDSFTCCHCNGIVLVEPKKVIGGYCRMCDDQLCRRCVLTGTCDPFEKKLDAWEQGERLMRAVRGAGAR